MPCRKRGKVAVDISRILVIIVTLIASIAWRPSPGHGATARQVLVVHSYHQGYRWTDDLTRGISDALQSEGKSVQVRYEYMDTKRVSDPSYFRYLFQVYNHKYRDSPFAVVIATDNDAFEFLKNYRDRLFPATPVVFCGVNYFDPSQLAGTKLFTGVNEAADIRATMDLALRLHPATREIVVINDTTTTGLIVHREVERLIPAYRDRVKFLFLEEMTMREILDRVRKLGPDSLVFYGLFFRDRAGSFFEYDEAIALIAESSPVPVYGVWDFYLGNGLTGGMLTSGYHQGETAGRMALRILRGEPVEAIPVIMKSPNRFMFDYRQMQRFHISPEALPEGSTVINEPSTLYHVPRNLFWGAVAALAASAVIIILLLHNSAIRRRAERELRESFLKYRIVSDNTYNWEYWLDAEGRFLYTSPSCQRLTGHTAAEFHADPELLTRMVHADDAGQFVQHRHEVTSKRAEAELEFRIVRPNGELRWIHHVCLPVFDDSGHYLGTRASNSDITERKLAEEKNLRLAEIVNSSDDAIIGKNMDGTISSWNRGAERIFGYTEAEMIGRPVGTLIPPEHLHEVLQIHDRIRRGEHVEHFETVRTRKDGKRLTISLTYSPVTDEKGRVVAISTIGRDVTELKNAERLRLESARINRELEIAKDIQQSFLASCPESVPGILMAGCCIPAAHVGGDYYDVFTPLEGMVDMVIADISGHSVGSALLMSETRSVLHARISAQLSPGKLLAAVNDLLQDDLWRAELQITMFYARLDTRKMTLSFASAGHPPPILYRCSDGVLEQLDADGLLLGIRKGITFEEKSIEVKPGDTLLMYTDGVIEAENPQGELFGSERLGRIVTTTHRLHPRRVIDSIMAELTIFAADRPRTDDVTIVASTFQ